MGGTPADAAAAARRAWQAFLERHPDTETVDLIIPDLVGVARGKRLTTKGLASALEHGLTFASSVYGMDTTGAIVDASGLIWEEGDADRPCPILADTFAPVPWQTGGAQVLAGLLDDDGSPFFADPRAVLAQVAGRFEPLGLRPVAAVEMEFYLLDRRSVTAGEPRPACQSDGRLPSETQVYGLGEIDDQNAFLVHLTRFCAALDVPIKSAVAEYAPGQYEVNLGHVDNAARAADHALLLKRAIKAAANAVDLEATFMAKPFADRASSGMHVHLSLIDRAGNNAFAADEALVRHALGGLQATMAEAMLLFAPNANSFRRLRPRSYAPLAPTWGYNNRTVALRVPAAAAEARRIEHRTAGADANPYLVLAAILAGIHHGLEHELEPDAPIRGDAYVQAEPSLPMTWDRALDAFAAAKVLPGYLGERFCPLYRACRAAERDRFADVVTPTEYAWYLRPV